MGGTWEEGRGRHYYIKRVVERENRRHNEEKKQTLRLNVRTLNLMSKYEEVEVKT